MASKKTATLKGSQVKSVLINSYQSKKNVKDIQGLTYKKNQSNREHQLYLNKDKKPIVVITGTRKPTDIITDTRLAVGNIKNTQRYRREKKYLNTVKKKYGNNVTIVGNSLGGTLSSNIATKKDKVISHNPGVGIRDIGRKIKNNETRIRAKNDVVSLLSKTQKNKKNIITTDPRTNIDPLGLNIYNQHLARSIKGIKNKTF
jgi:hypothetical protein